MSPRSQCLKSSSVSCADAVDRDVELDAAGHVLDASRSTPCPSRASASCGRRPSRGTPSASSASLVSATVLRVKVRRERIAAEVVRVGVSVRARSAASLPRRSAMIWFSSCGAALSLLGQACSCELSSCSGCDPRGGPPEYRSRQSARGAYRAGRARANRWPVPRPSSTAKLPTASVRGQYRKADRTVCSWACVRAPARAPPSSRACAAPTRPPTRRR